MNWYEKKNAEAVEGLTALLALPTPEKDDIGVEGFFDPWALFPSLYGSYDQAFDICAIEVLTEVRDGQKHRDDLGAEMIREMLCTSGLCTYGTSPRFCFPDRGFEALLPALIEKWTAFSETHWGTDDAR